MEFAEETNAVANGLAPRPKARRTFNTRILCFWEPLRPSAVYRPASRDAPRRRQGLVRGIRMDKEEIERRVGSFPRWHYEFDLEGVKTPIAFDS